MAEESGGGSWWGDWGNEFFENIKAKSSETMAMVKQDLSEFMTTVQGDTTSVIADTATVVKDQLQVNEEDQDSTSGKLKQGMSDWFGTISSALKDNLSQVANTAAASFVEVDGPVFDRSQARLNEIQTDPTTYCSEPDGHPHLYDDWCKRFDLEQCKGEISELLVNKPKVRALYTNLVPSAVSHSLFWQRYFYKVYQLNQEEKKRAALVERANKLPEEDLGWGDDEDDDFWGTAGSGEDVEQTLKHYHESLHKVASTIHKDSGEEEKAQPSGLMKDDVASANNGARSGGHNYVKEVTQFQETGGDSKDITTTCTSETHQSADKRDDAETSLEGMAHTNKYGAASEKKRLDEPQCAPRSDGGDSSDFLVPTAKAESSKVLPISEPKTDSSEVETQPNLETVKAETSKESKKSFVSTKTSQPKCDTPELEEATLGDVVTRDDMDSSSVEKLRELAVHSQQSLHQIASSTGSGDSSWSKLSEEANDGKDDDFWGTAGSSSDVIQTLKHYHESLHKAASTIHRDAGEEEKAHSSGLLKDDIAAANNGARSGGHSQQSLYQRASSTGSGDSSWSKLSEEANDGKANPSLSKSSSSSSSGVLVPSIDDKDIEWDNALDLDEDITEEEMKKIMESLGTNELGKLGELELDDDDWDDWE